MSMTTPEMTASDEREAIDRAIEDAIIERLNFADDEDELERGVTIGLLNALGIVRGREANASEVTETTEA